MKRSRRSLGLLLVAMAASLALVRATTQPPPDLESLRDRVTQRPRGMPSGRADGTADDGDHASVDRRPRASVPRALLSCVSRSVVPSVTPSPLFTVPLALPPFISRPVAVDPSPVGRPVSMVSVIVIISPSAGDHEALGCWSGCSAFAVGCDHLGRTLGKRSP